MSFSTIPAELSVVIKSLVRIWSIKLALVLVILVSVVMAGIKKFWKFRLR